MNLKVGDLVLSTAIADDEKPALGQITEKIGTENPQVFYYGIVWFDLGYVVHDDIQTQQFYFNLSEYKMRHLLYE